MNKIMRTKIVCLFLCIIILCSSCDSYFKKLDGIDFSVGWINMPELTNLPTEDLVGLRRGVLLMSIGMNSISLLSNARCTTTVLKDIIL